MTRAKGALRQGAAPSNEPASRRRSAAPGAKKRSGIEASSLRKAFHLEVQAWAQKIGVQPKRIQIQRMTRKWASWSSSGRICFSDDLLSEPESFREVVIVHELLHCIVPNHGKLFKSLMKAYLPNPAKAVPATSYTCSKTLESMSKRCRPESRTR